MNWRSYRCTVFRINCEGAIALATMLILGVVFIQIGLAGAFVAYTLTNTNYGSRLSAEAYAAAQAGIDDGLLRFVRNSAASMNQQSYIITLGNRTVNVLLCRQFKFDAITGTCSLAADSSYAEIVATGHALLKRRSLRATLSIHPITGVVRLVSLIE